MTALRGDFERPAAHGRDVDPARSAQGTAHAGTATAATCPDCGEVGRYDARVKIRGRGVYTCPAGHRWQDMDEVPSTKGYIEVTR